MADTVRWLVLMLSVAMVTSSPVSYHDPDSHPLAELGQRLVSHSSLLDARSQDPRLPIPTPQDIEAIKKVAQILVMLGEQVIPSLMGDPGSPHTNTPAAEEIPNDPVEA